MNTAFEICPGTGVGKGHPYLVLAGPCVIENEAQCLEIGETLLELCRKLKLGYVFKASFDKANRTSAAAYRGPGMEKGLRILNTVRQQLKVPIITDLHTPEQAERVATAVDILQIPAFLCRQTDLLLAAGQTDKVINIKKGQFMAPDDMRHAVDKVRTTGNERIMLTERGTSFGYHNLVVDMRGLGVMRGHGVPVIFDGTHSVQLPGGRGDASGGDRRFVPPLVRAATAAGIDGVFLETHPCPDQALCDGANSMPLTAMPKLLETARRIHELVN